MTVYLDLSKITNIKLEYYAKRWRFFKNISFLLYLFFLFVFCLIDLYVGDRGGFFIDLIFAFIFGFFYMYFGYSQFVCDRELRWRKTNNINL